MSSEFYFVRHGQTDHNVTIENAHLDHPEEMSLNVTGRNQALAIEPWLAQLPIQTVCSSPLKRAYETKDLLSLRLPAEHHVVDELRECSAQVWKEISSGCFSTWSFQTQARHFVDKVKKGIDHVLSLPSPALIVAHGGVHWAICYLLGIENHEWMIGHCIPVHFAMDRHGKWIARTGPISN